MSDNVLSQGGLGNTTARPPKTKVRDRAYTWCFTWNNYSDADVAFLQQVDCKYLVCGREVGEQGTPHLQGTIQFKTQRDFSTIKKLLPLAHIEKCKDLLASVKYCKKDDNFFETGLVPTDGGPEGGSKEKMRWKLALEQAREKGECDDAEIQFKYRRLIQAHREDFLSKEVANYSEGKHLWLWGEPGTGKSRHARSINEKYYLKFINQYWDGYSGEEVVIIDDIDRSHGWMLNNLKTWCDVHSFRANVKYGGCVIRPKLIVVTSNFKIEEIWGDPRDHEPLKRRFDIIEFKRI